MVFFTDEDFDSFASEVSNTNPVFLICQSITTRFDEQKKLEGSMLDDLRHQDSTVLNVLFCSSDFPSSKVQQGTEHILLEQWIIKPMMDTWDDSTAILWNDNALTKLTQGLPCKMLKFSQMDTLYGSSPLPVAPSNAPKGSFSVRLNHPEWKCVYEVSVSFASNLDFIWKGTKGRILIETDDTSIVVDCDHSLNGKELLSPELERSEKRMISKPIPIKHSAAIQIPLKSESQIPGSPRYPVAPFQRRRTKSTNSARNLSVSPGADLIGAFAGSLQESLLSGHVSTKSTVFSGFSAKLTASSPHNGSSAHIQIPFDTHYYHLEDFNRTPYAASIILPQDRFRIAPAGLLQVTLSNPSGTPIKVFVVRYDLSTMPPNSKTFLRQITRTAEPPHILQYAVQFTIICTKHKRLYIYKNIRVVFPHRVPDEQEKLEVICQSPDSPQFFQV